MKIKRFLLVSLLSTLGFAQTFYSGSLHQTNAELTTISIPNPVPSIGNLNGAGFTYTSAIYGNTITRCTDVNTDPSNITYHSWEISDNGAGGDAVWNSNHTMLRGIEMTTGTTRIIGFDPIAQTCTIANLSSKTAAGAVWDTTDPDVDWTLTGTVIGKRVFDYTHPLNAPTLSTVYDFRSCPGLVTMGTVIWSAQLSMSNDGTLVTAFSDLGIQNTGEYVATYNINTGQCEVYNTLTNTLAGSVSGTSTTLYTFSIHDVEAYPGGLVTIGVGSTCNKCPSPHGPFLWRMGTLKVKLIQIDAGGHNSTGYNTYINIVNSPKFASRNFGSPGTVTYITSNAGVSFPNPQDTHLSWQNVDPKDSNPIFASQMSTKLPQPMQITSPLQAEIWAAVPATGEFIRFAQTMSSGIPNPFNNFRSEYAIALVSPDGACVAWSSDWEGTLGNADGMTSTCTLGADKPNACRSDIFVTCPK